MLGKVRPSTPRLQTATPKEIKADLRARHLAWIERLLADTGWSVSRLARECGLRDTTLSRFVRDDYDGALTAETVARIVARLDVVGPDGGGPAPTPVGLREDGAEWIGEDAADPLAALVAAALRDRPNAHPFVMRSDMLQLAGVRAGDVLIVELGLAPRDGDVVVAQQEIGSGARTLIRLWQQPNLVAAALDPTAARPLAVDGETIRIAGVMTDLLRRRA